MNHNGHEYGLIRQERDEVVKILMLRIEGHKARERYLCVIACALGVTALTLAAAVVFR